VRDERSCAGWSRVEVERFGKAAGASFSRGTRLRSRRLSGARRSMSALRAVIDETT
jgi:hypothetical protein